MADEKPKRITVGFHGGGVLAARVEPKVLKRLQGLLPNGGWHELMDADGADISMDLSRVAYVRVESDEHRVGF